ncbi:hypothetical protein FACS189464_0750 [Bacteroidia bacterium]|nr:hypothetical protein FACS189464_0750 [Bacteroidia bacterium]
MPKLAQSITWSQTLTATYGDSPITLNATASSGLGITYESSNTAVATISGNMLNIVGLGAVTITARQAGNADYNAATNITKTFTVTAGPITVSVTNTNDDGAGSLRQAITDVNANTDGGTINVNLPKGSVITLASTLPSITNTKEITINGNGVTVSGNNAYRILSLSSGVVSISRVHFTKGYSFSGGSAISIYDCSITLQSCIFSMNSMGYPGIGGSIQLQGGSLTVAGCTFYGNSASNGGAIYATSRTIGTVSGIGGGTVRTIAAYTFLTGNLFYNNSANGNNIVSTNKTSTTTSYGYNVSDYTSGVDAKSGSGFTFATGDKTETSLTFNTHSFLPTETGEATLKIVPSGATNFPTVDFYGVERSPYPGIAGALGHIYYTVTFVPQNGDANTTASIIKNSTIATPTLPACTGYNMGGWYKDVACTDKWNFTSDLVTNDISLYAKWSVINYTITYNNVDGAINNNPATYTIESDLITLVNPVRAGYEFDGWQEGSSIAAGSTGNKFFTAQWTPITYTISYILNGGTNHASNPADYTVEENIVLQNPTKNGYTFIGWVEGSSIATGSTGNKTFTAQWTPTNYTISYELNGGTNHTGNPANYTIESAVITLQNPIKTGYTFGGWQEGSNIAAGSTGNKTFTAQWTPTNYTISYELNGGTNHVGNPDNYTIESSGITLQTPTKTGYTFDGWQEGNTIATGSTGNKTFTAQWTLTNYTISYKLNDGTNHTGNPANYTIESSVITLQTPVKTGYTFGGWQEGSNIAAGSTGNKTFTANWNAISYSITYNNLNGVSNNSNPTTYTIENNISLASPGERSGYAFMGWEEGNSIVAGSMGSKTFTAQWSTATAYTVTYILNGGTNNPGNPPAYTVESPNITLQAPAKTGYTFEGWTEGNSITAGSTGNKSFTAEWSVIRYAISYELNGGTNHTGNPANYTIESSGITLQAPAKTGYTFEGWTEGNTVAAGSTGNKTFTAQWSITNYAISYELNGGTNHTGNPANYTIESSVITLQVPVKTGYTFNGWAEGSSITAGSTGNKTFTAQWTPTKYIISYELNGGTNHTGNPANYTIESTVITLQTPARAGYTFGDWQEGNTIAAGSTGNKTFTAQWTPVNYTISYELNGGTNHVGNPDNYTIESSVITLQVPVKTGYTFNGWAEGSSITTGSTGNKTFTAQWTPTKYIISYELDGGTNHTGNPANYTIESTVITLQTPARAGYTFGGWQEGNTIAAGSTGNKTFTTQWTPVNYTISYELNGGTNHVGNPDTYNIESTGITLQRPAKTGYTFTGWTEGNTIATGSTGSKTFTAQWTPIHYTISYTLDGGINHVNNPATYTIENNVTLQNPTKAGWVFMGWIEGNVIRLGGTGNLTFTAQWALGAKPVINTLPVSRITTTSATLSGSVQFAGAPVYTQRGVCYSTNNKPTLTKSGVQIRQIAGNGLGAYSTDVSGLLPNTNYYMCAYVANGVDTIYGDVKLFTTRRTPLFYTLEKRDFKQRNPSLVDMMVHVRDQDGKGASYLEDEDFEVWEDDVFTKSTETHSYVRKMDAIPFVIKTALVLDFTSSLDASNAQGINKMKAAVKNLIDAKASNQEYAIVLFSDRARLWQDFTNDASTLIQCIDAIEPDDAVNTTKLYDGYKKGLDILQPDVFENSFVQRNFMIVFTDGKDQSSTATLSQCVTARGNRPTYVMGLGDVDASVLKQLAYPSSNYKPLANISELESMFSQIQSEILRDVNSLYQLSYMSPKRGEAPNLKLRIKNNTNTGATSYASANFDATYFVSAQYGLYVNPYTTWHGTAIGKYGFTNGTAYTVSANDTLQAVSYWAETVPLYEWMSSDTSVIKVKKIDFNKAQFHFTGKNGSAIIDVKDVGNYNYVSNGYNSTIEPANALAFQKSFIVNGNGTLSVYNRGSYTVNFNADGGAPAPLTQRVRSEAQEPSFVQEPSFIPFKKGYHFVGWFNGSARYDFDAVVMGNTTLTAHWQLLPFEVNTALAAGITKDSATLGGSVVLVSGADYTKRGVCYGTTLNPTVSNTNKEVSSSETDFSIRVGRLSANTTYYVRAYALNAQDTIYGDNITFTTRAATPYYRITGLSTVVKKPSFVDVLVSVKDYNGKGADYLENKDFELLENNAPLNSESYSYIRKMDAIPFKLKTVLMLDNSSSLGYDGFEQLKQAAIELVRNKNEKQEFAVYSFSDNAVLVQEFSANTDVLVQGISQITLGSSTTDLYGSYVTGMNKLPAEYSTKDSIQKCFFVMISDGDETQHKYTPTLENTAKAARGTKTAYMIGLGQDLNTARLTALASSSANYYSAANISIVKSYFTQIQNDMWREANSFYNLTYLTSKQDVGSVTLRLRLNNNTNGNADGYYQTTFNSSGMVATNAGVYLNAYQTVPGISGTTSKFGIALADGATAAQRRDTISGVFSFPNGFAFQAVTYYADVTPKYVWTSSNPAVATVEGTGFDKGIVSFSGNSTDITVITVKDVANYDIISSGKGLTPSTQAPYFQRSIRVQGMILHTVTFETNNGTPIPVQKVTPNTICSPPTAPAKQGYTFDGWYKEPACINVWNFASNAVTDNTTLYAKWNLVSYTITYNNMNGATNSNPANYTVESSLISLVNPGTRAGYTFTGWEEGSAIPANSTGNKTFTAQWSQIMSAATPSITAHPQGSTVNAGSNAVLSITANVTDGGTLSYQWYKNTTNNNSGGTIAGSNSNSYYPSTTTAGTLYYYVVVTNTNNSVNGATTATVKSNVVSVTVMDDNGSEIPVTCTVTFDVNGGSPTPAQQQVEQGGKATDPVTPTRPGYIFGGWLNGNTLYDFNTAVTANLTLTAKWTATSEDNKNAVSGTIANVPADTKVYLYVNPNLKAGVPAGYELVSITATDAAGHYTFANLPKGTYIVIVEMEGYESQSSKAITFTGNATEINNVNFAVDNVNHIIKPSDSVTGVETQLIAFLQAYPNPFTGSVHLKGAEGSILQVSATNGAVVHTQKVVSPDEIISLEKLPAGLYFFRVEKDGKVQTLKVIKQ